MSKYVIWSNGNKIPFEKLAFAFHIPEDLVEGYVKDHYPELEIVSDKAAPVVERPLEAAPVESGDEEPKPKPRTGLFSKDKDTQKGVNE